MNKTPDICKEAWEKYGRPLAGIREGVGGIVPHGPVFHWRDGWCFCRGENLIVHVWNRDKNVDLEIPAGEWASIVNALET
jgi:hypothetical protein